MEPSSQSLVMDQPLMLADGAFVLFENGLFPAPGLPTLDQYNRAFMQLRAMERCHRWWVGDLFNAAQQEYQEDEVFQLFDEHDYERGTVLMSAWVCERIPAGRRRSELSFTHHQAVAPLEPARQDRLLTAAVENNWTVTELRREARAMQGKPRRLSLIEELDEVINDLRKSGHGSCADKVANAIAKSRLK